MTEKRIDWMTREELEKEVQSLRTENKRLRDGITRIREQRYAGLTIDFAQKILDGTEC